MRIVLSISEKAVRALRVAAAEQGCRGVSAFVESVYGGDPLPVSPFKGELAGWLEKLERKAVDNEQKIGSREYTVDERDKIWETIKRLGLVPSEQGPPVAPFVGGVGKLVAGGIVPDPIVAEEGTLGESQYVDLDGVKHGEEGKLVLKEVPGEGHG